MKLPNIINKILSVINRTNTPAPPPLPTPSYTPLPSVLFNTGEQASQSVTSNNYNNINKNDLYLNKLLRDATPSAQGLYPHEILMLTYAFTYKTANNNFKQYWKYKYFVDEPQKILDSLYERGFIEKGPIRLTIQKLTVNELKNELRSINAKVTGKKAELIDRLLENADAEQLNRKFPDRYYVLTEKGEREIAENKYIEYAHHKDYITIWELNYLLNNNNPRNLGYRDIIWGYLNQNALNQLKTKDYGEYYSTKLAMYRFLLEEDKYDTAFFTLCEIIAYNLSTLHTNQPNILDDKFSLELALEYDFPYDKHSSLVIPPGNVSSLANLIDKLNLSKQELEELLYKNFKLINLPKRIFTIEECVEIVICELEENTDKLNEIYNRAEKMLRQRLRQLG